MRGEPSASSSQWLASEPSPKIAPVAKGASSKLVPRAPLYVFGRVGDARWPMSALPLPALFPFHREGVQTNRDAVCVDADRDALLARLRAFAARADAPAARPAHPTRSERSIRLRARPRPASGPAAS